MDWVYAVIGLAILECFVFSMLVGFKRVKTGVEAPAVTGDPVFERYYRVHYNTIEQLIIFIPAILLFAHYISATVAAGLGVLFVIGRLVYLRLYTTNPAKRGPGFGLSMLPTIILLLGGLGGALWSAINS